MKLGPVFAFLFLAPLSTHSKLALPLDCNDIHRQNANRGSGVYTIYPIGVTSAVQVFCDMETQGGNWTVFQRRMDGTVNFYRPWEQYRVDFGNAAGEYWLGLEYIHQLTSQRDYELRVDMEDFEGTKAFARYSSFSVDEECEGYKLEVSGFTDGGAGDALRHHTGHKFSTFDKDQDIWSENCAKKFIGAFWYAACHASNPNGVYRWGADNSISAIAMSWFPYKGPDYSLKAISMKIRRVA